MPIIRIISETRCRLEKSSRATVALVDEAISFEHPGYERSAQYRIYKAAMREHKLKEKKAGRSLPKPYVGWDGKTHLLVNGSQTFPLGLLSTVESVLRENGRKVRVLDERQGLKGFAYRRSARLPRHSEPTEVGKRLLEAGPRVLRAPPDDLIPFFDKHGREIRDARLRDDQTEAVARLLHAERGILWAGTGSGKTEVAIALAKWLLDHGWPGDVLFLTHQKKLVRDTAARFQRALGDAYSVGMLSEGKFEPDCDVVVASVQTLMSKRGDKLFKKWRANFTVLIVDECHHLGSDSWYRAAMKVPARLRFGLSGTPLDRGDNKNLKVIGATGPVAYEIRSDKLIKLGVLAEPTVHIIPIREPSDIHDLDWDFAYGDGITGNLYRNSRIVAKAGKHSMRGDRVLILVQELAHGWNIQNALRYKGIKADFVHGESKSSFVDFAVERLNTGARKVLIASPIFREGIDIPSINVLCVADGGRSVIKTLQQIGRGLRRKKKGENRVTVYDFLDETNTYLLEHSQDRIKTYQREGFKVVIEEA